MEKIRDVCNFPIFQKTCSERTLMFNICDIVVPNLVKPPTYISPIKSFLTTPKTPPSAP